MYRYVCSCFANANPKSVTAEIVEDQTVSTRAVIDQARQLGINVRQYIAIANAGKCVNGLSERAFVASFRNSGERIRDPREQNMNANDAVTRSR